MYDFLMTICYNVVMFRGFQEMLLVDLQLIRVMVFICVNF